MITHDNIKNGYYWVKEQSNDKPEIARWSEKNDCWLLTGIEDCLEFSEVEVLKAVDSF